jgi:trans-aconitate methyltransferase
VRTPSTEEEPAFYLRLLHHHHLERKVVPNIWTTTYCHRLVGENPVADFFAGSGLGAYLDSPSMPADHKEAFVRLYRELIARAYPKEEEEKDKDKQATTVLLMKRFFLVASLQ